MIEIPRWEQMTVADALELAPAIAELHRDKVQSYYLDDKQKAAAHDLKFVGDGIAYQLRFTAESSIYRIDQYEEPLVKEFGSALTAEFGYEDADGGESVTINPRIKYARWNMQDDDLLAEKIPGSRRCIMPFVVVHYLNHVMSAQELASQY